MEGWDDMFGYDDFVGSGVGTTPESNEDRFYDPDGITEPEIDEMEEW
ncbi:MAG: hypothetical protein PVG39_24185 [Desulfobacteraceae bacterium]|jgi:hypothetical protein